MYTDDVDPAWVEREKLWTGLPWVPDTPCDLWL